MLELKKDTQRSSSTALSVFLFFVFIAVMLEKPTSHRHVVQKGSRTEIALFARMGNSLAAVSQKLSKGWSAKLSFRPRFCLSSVISFCSCKFMSFPNTVELDGFLTQSRQSLEKWGEITWQLLLKTLQMFTYCLTQCSTDDTDAISGRFSFRPCSRVFRSFRCWNISARYASFAHHSSLESNLVSSYFWFVKNTLKVLPQLIHTG